MGKKSKKNSQRGGQRPFINFIKKQEKWSGVGSLRLPHGMNVNAGMKTWGALATLPILLRGLCLHTSIGEIKYTPMQLAASLS